MAAKKKTASEPPLPRAYFAPEFFVRNGGEMLRPMCAPSLSRDDAGTLVNVEGRHVFVPWRWVMYVE